MQKKREVSTSEVHTAIGFKGSSSALKILNRLAQAGVIEKIPASARKKGIRWKYIGDKEDLDA